MTQEDRGDERTPSGFEKMANSILGAIDETIGGEGPWYGHIETFDLIDPTDGTRYTHQNGSLQGRAGREVEILVELEDTPDDVPLDPKGWIIEYTGTDDERHVRGTVVGSNSIVDGQSKRYHTLHFVPDPGSDPARSNGGSYDPK